MIGWGRRGVCRSWVCVGARREVLLVPPTRVGTADMNDIDEL